MVGQVLSFETCESRGFPNAGYRWIYVWHYTLLDETSTHQTILSSLLADENYAHSFIAPYPSPFGWVEGPKVRGPYLLDHLAADSFTPITDNSAWDTIDTFLRSWNIPASRADLDLEHLVGSIVDDAAELFQLRQDDAAHHELHWMLGDWAEIVAIDRKAGIVLDVAMGYD
jgi:hypothetical protein